ncbi:MAG: CBS domain-containing protein [Deltaproteobacteria bacterium]|nr:CBS domain-containing protein [Deltaproteobacteria bacterium]MCW5807593.1 CBS domain-containing protein [Deltaproteobacteria bacterium]
MRGAFAGKARRAPIGRGALARVRGMRAPVGPVATLHGVVNVRSTVKLIPRSQVALLAVTDTVRDAFDRLETRELFAAPLVDTAGRYIGMITEADLRRHVAAQTDRIVAFAMPVGKVARGALNAPVREGELALVLDEHSARASMHAFVPVVDGTGRLVGIVERDLYATRDAA